MTNDVERYEPRKDVALVDPTGGRLVSWAHAAQAAKQLADALSSTSFVPKIFQGQPDDAAAAIMYGDEIGFTPGQSLQNIYVISGKPALYARAMVALVLSKGHEIWTEASSPQRVIVCGRRRGTKNVERVEWTRAKAEQAGYTTNKKYQSAPEDMLYARASGTIARRVAPDALMGVAYTVEELELGISDTTVTVTQEEPPKKRTAQRASAKKEFPAADEPDLDESKPEPSITKPQLTKLHILAQERGIEDDRDGYLRYLTNIAGRDIESSKELTVDEASRVIDSLEKDVNALKPKTDEAAEPDPNEHWKNDA